MEKASGQSWLDQIRDWGISTAQKLLENKLFGGSSGAPKTPSPTSPDVSSELKKWLPYGLIGGALIFALFAFKGKK
jgi:hypothetical protein